MYTLTTNNLEIIWDEIDTFWMESICDKPNKFYKNVLFKNFE